LAPLPLTVSSERASSLDHTCLRYAVAHGADLSGAILDDADMRGCDITGANLTSASLRRVEMDGTIGYGRAA